MRYLQPAAFLLLLVGSSVPLLSRAAMATEEVPTTPAGTSTDKVNLPTATSSPTGTVNVATLSTLLDSAQGDANRSLIESVSFSSSPRTALLSKRTSAIGISLGAVPSEGVLLEDDVVQKPQFSQAIAADTADSGTSSGTSEEAGFTIEVQAQATESNTLEDMEDFRQLVQAAQAQAPEPRSEPEPTPAPEPTPETEDLPTLEETTPPPTAPPAESSSDPADTDPADNGPAEESAEPVDDGLVEIEENTDIGEPDLGEIDTEEPVVEPIPPDAEIDAARDSLISDPNPLSVPVFSEEIDVDRNPLVTLDEAIQLAYQNNQALQTSILQLEQSEAALAEQRAALLPSISTSADIQDQQQGSVDQIQLGGAVTLNYDLFTGGGRKASIRAAELQVDVSALAVEAQQEQLSLVTANLYYALQESIEQIRINQAFVDEAERNLRDSELRQEVGVGTRFDVLRAEVQLANAQQALVQSQFDEDIARRDIARLLNLPPTAGLQTTPVERAEDWPLDLEESILLAFQNRSELEQQLRQSDISEQQRRIALAAIRPQVSIVASYGLETILDSSVPVATGEFEDTSILALNLNWTLFNGGASRAAARQQEIGETIAEEQFSETLDEIRFEVEQAFFNIQANEANISTSNGAVIQAEAALELANLRLQAGVGTQLDVLTAQSELTQAQVNNVAAILGYNRALVAIQRAISNLRL